MPDSTFVYLASCLLYAAPGDGADSRRYKESTSDLVLLMRETSWVLLVMSRTHPVAQ